MRRALPALAAALLFAAATAHAQPDTSPHLLAGVRAFRDGRFAEALVEFRVVERSPNPPPELAFYLGPTLYKLGRHREALRVFLASPAERDPLTDFYLGTTLYQLRLYNAAATVFRGLRRRDLGPKLREAAEAYVARVEALFAEPPPADAVAQLVREGQAALAAGDVFVGAAYLEEALRAAALAPARPAPPALRQLEEAAFSTAKRHHADGDRRRARPLLEALAAGSPARGGEARRMLLEGAR